MNKVWKHAVKKLGYRKPLSDGIAPRSVNGGNGKLLLSAMITNFRTRIDLLQEVLVKIENIKNLNPYYDTETTI